MRKIKQNQSGKPQIPNQKSSQQKLNQFCYKDKKNSQVSRSQQTTNLKKDQNEPNLMRTDIFLIKVKINDIRINQKYKPIIQEELNNIKKNLNQKIEEKQDQLVKTPSKLLQASSPRKQLKQIQQFYTEVQNYSLSKLVNGKVCFRIIEKNPFYASFQHFKNQQKPNQSSCFDHLQIRSFEQTQKIVDSFIPNFNQENTKTNKKSKIQFMSKISQHSLLKLILSSLQLTNSKQKNKKFNAYEQNYKLKYKRLIKQKNDKDVPLNQNKVQSSEKSEIKVAVQQRPLLKNLFKQADSLMFAGTEESVFEMKFEQLEISEAFNYLKKQNEMKQENLPGFNVFWANFRMKNFCQFPFTEHMITTKLYHKLQNRQNQEKQIKKSQRTDVEVDLSLYMVPGDKNGWGVLNINQLEINWDEFMIINQKRRRMKLKIEFPDVIQRNKWLIKQETSYVETKIQVLQFGENILWTEDISININPQKNKLRFMLIQILFDGLEIFESIIAQRKVYLLEDGFLHDQIQSTRHIQLKSYHRSQEEQKKNADLTIMFNFEISLSDQIIPEKLVQGKSNTFVSHFGTLQ